jgi:predicted Zn finger-like uncharacterized protein
MDVRCEKCLTVYELDDRCVHPEGLAVKCAECGNVFTLMPVETAEYAPGLVHKRGGPIDSSLAVRPASTFTGDRDRAASAGSAGAHLGTAHPEKIWLIRRSHSREVMRLRELTTLQQWIVERRLSREDQISLSGEHWKPLGGIAELEPFFQVVEQAAAVAISHQGSPVRSSEPPRVPRASEGLPPLAASGPIALGTPIPGSEPAFTSTGCRQIVGMPAPPYEVATSSVRPRRGGLFAGLLALLLLAFACGYLVLYRSEALRRLVFPDDGRGKEAYRQGREFFLLDTEDSFRQAAAAFERAHGADAQNALALGGLAEVHVTWASYLLDEVRAIEEDRSSPIATLKREAQGHLDEAKRFASEALMLRQDLGAVHRAMADYLRVSNAPPLDVNRHLQRAVALLPNDPETLYVAGALALREGRPEEAERDFGRANQLNQAATQHALLRASFLLARLRISAGRVEEARRLLQAILQANGQHDRARALLRIVDNIDAGIHPVASAHPSPSDSPPTLLPSVPGAQPIVGRPAGYHALIAQADRLAEDGRSREARKLYERALELSPKGREALAGLAYCELDAESFVAAILHFKQALGLAPEFGEAIIGLAEAYKMRGDKDEAVSYYKRYLQVLPNGSRATMAQKNLRDLESGVSEAVEHGSNESEGRRALPRPPVVEDSAL